MNNELYPILIGELWDKIGIDIIELLLITKWKNRYIITYINYIIKWIETKFLFNKLAK